MGSFQASGPTKQENLEVPGWFAEHNIQLNGSECVTTRKKKCAYKARRTKFQMLSAPWTIAKYNESFSIKIMC